MKGGFIMEARIRFVVMSLVLAAGLVLATSVGSLASCAADDSDGALVAAARATAEANCTALGRGCANAASHGQYVSCIAHEVKTLSSGETPTLPRSCKGAVK